MVADHAMNLVHLECEAAAVAAAHQQSGFPAPLAFSSLGREIPAQSKQFTERHTEKQFSPDAHDTAYDSSAMVRQTVDFVLFDHLIEKSCRQSQPLRSYPKNQDGFQARLYQFLFRSDQPRFFRITILPTLLDRTVGLPYWDG